MVKKYCINNSFVTWAKRRNIPVTYKTVVLVPYYDGYKNVLTQDMINKENIKYVIKYDYWLNGETITVPENSILEFDGGTLHNGTIIGQDTFINDIGGLGLEKIFTEDIIIEGTWRTNGGGSFEQVQSDWNENNSYKKSFIKNKPTLASVATSGSYSDLKDTPAIPAEQIQVDWNQTNSEAKDFIKNKPNIPEEVTVDTTLSKTSTNPVQNKVITEALDTDKSYDSTKHSGLGQKSLKLKEGGSNVLMQTDFDAAHTIYVIQYDFTLGEDITIPADCVLKFNGGSISNGTIFGNDTQISTDSENIFTNVVIGGTWNVPYISSTWFSDATADNTIKQIFNLTNPDVKNVVTIHEGLYSVSVSADRETVIALNSNTDVKMAGTIQLQPNAFENYDIIQILDAHNVTVDGGTIIGDKVNHTGTTGEWGMGIDIDHSKDVVISNIVIKDCWGDSVYIGSSNNGVSENIKIENFNLSGSRRQGISVINAKNLTIVNGFISDINGTLPMCCIDLEPNVQTDIIENVVIKNVTCNNSRLGIVSYYNDTSAELIKGIIVENCFINGTSFRCTQNVKITNCSYDSNIGTLPKISFYYCTDVVVENCKVNDIISDLSTAVEQCIFILGTPNSLFDEIELETNRQCIIRNDRYNRMINSTLVNTSDNGTLYREDIRISDCLLQNNRIEVNKIHLPSWTNMIGNICTCKSLICDWGNVLSDNVITAERITLAKYCSIINSNITAEHCLFGDCIVSSNHITSKNEITTGIKDFIYCENVQIVDNIIEYNANPYTDSVVLKVGNRSKIINNKVVLTKAPTQNVFRGLYATTGVLFENNTVDRSALEEAQEVSYINTELTHNNKVVVPLKTIGTLEERNSLDTFYLINGFMYFVTDSNPAKWTYRNNGAWADL